MGVKNRLFISVIISHIREFLILFYEAHETQPTFNSAADLLDTHLKERVHQSWAYSCNQRAHKEMKKDLSTDKTVISLSKS